ncbi:MAG: hypothetical protein NTV63_03055 [Candidatus Woesearchaeota archaeon]|nr:hypothetical protein [Candidatus Woesearchaeota archaeon]
MFGNEKESDPLGSMKENDEAGGMGQPQKQRVDISTDYGLQMSNLARRLRMLEERYNSMQKRIQLIEENMLANNRKASTDIKTINSTILDLNAEIAQIKERIEQVIRELVVCAKKEDINVLERYLNLWDPTSFATLKDVENIVRREIQKAVSEKNSESFKKE